MESVFFFFFGRFFWLKKGKKKAALRVLLQGRLSHSSQPPVQSSKTGGMEVWHVPVLLERQRWLGT